MSAVTNQNQKTFLEDTWRGAKRGGAQWRHFGFIICASIPVGRILFKVSDVFSESIGFNGDFPESLPLNDAEQLQNHSISAQNPFPLYVCIPYIIGVSTLTGMAFGAVMGAICHVFGEPQ